MWRSAQYVSVVIVGVANVSSERGAGRNGRGAGGEVLTCAKMYVETDVKAYNKLRESHRASPPPRNEAGTPPIFIARVNGWATRCYVLMVLSSALHFAASYCHTRDQNPRTYFHGLCSSAQIRSAALTCQHHVAQLLLGRYRAAPSTMRMVHARHLAL